METQNSGTVNWLLLRGLAREKRHWGKFPSLLQQKCSGDVVLLDLPGVGEKLHQQAPWSIGEYTDILRKEWQELKKQKTGEWGLIAISLGGMIAMDWTSRFQKDFSYLTLMNTSAANLCPIFQRLRPEALRTFLQLFLQKDVEKRESEILKLTTNLLDINKSLVKRWASFQREAPVSRETFFRQIMAASRFHAPEEIHANLLILLSESDRLTSADCSKTLAKHYNVPFHSHLTAGHDLPLDAPKWVIEEISGFLKQC